MHAMASPSRVSGKRRSTNQAITSTCTGMWGSDFSPYRRPGFVRTQGGAGFPYFTSLSVFSTPVCLTMCCEETFEVDHGTSALQFHSRSRYICSTVLPRKCSKRRSWLRVRCVQVSDFVQPAILLF